MKKLSDIHYAFIDEYMVNGHNALQAYQKVYKCSRETAIGKSSDLRNDLLVDAEIRRRQEQNAAKLKVTEELILDEIIQLLESCKKEGLNGDGKIKDRANWARAIDMLNKMTGMYASDRIEQQAQQVSNITVQIVPPKNNE